MTMSVEPSKGASVWPTGSWPGQKSRASVSLITTTVRADLHFLRGVGTAADDAQADAWRNSRPSVSCE